MRKENIIRLRQMCKAAATGQADMSGNLTYTTPASNRMRSLIRTGTRPALRNPEVVASPPPGAGIRAPEQNISASNPLKQLWQRNNPVMNTIRGGLNAASFGLLGTPVSEYAGQAYTRKSDPMTGQEYYESEAQYRPAAVQQAADMALPFAIPYGRIAGAGIKGVGTAGKAVLNRPVTTMAGERMPLGRALWKDETGAIPAMDKFKNNVNTKYPHGSSPDIPANKPSTARLNASKATDPGAANTGAAEAVNPGTSVQNAGAVERTWNDLNRMKPNDVLQRLRDQAAAGELPEFGRYGYHPSRVRNPFTWRWSDAKQVKEVNNAAAAYQDAVLKSEGVNTAGRKLLDEALPYLHPRVNPVGPGTLMLGGLGYGGYEGYKWYRGDPTSVPAAQPQETSKPVAPVTPDNTQTSVPAAQPQGTPVKAQQQWSGKYREPRPGYKPGME